MGNQSLKSKWLIIGNELYDDERIKNVSPVKNSVLLLERTLSDFSDPSIVTTLKQNLKNTDFHKAISSLYYDVANDVIPVFYFCGHGCRRQDKLYLLAKDSWNDAIEQTSVEYNYILQQIKYHQIAQAIILLDCCFSGTANGLANEEEFRPILPPKKYPNIICITSCKGIERAYFCDNDSRSYCAFTFLFSALLEKGIPNGTDGLSFDEIYCSIDGAISGQNPTILSTGVIASTKMLPNRFGKQAGADEETSHILSRKKGQTYPDSYVRNNESTKNTVDYHGNSLITMNQYGEKSQQIGNASNFVIQNY